MKTHIEIDGDDVRFIRTFEAPREMVFEAWTDPDKVQLWWGCAQTTAVESTIDLRVGGEYTHVMQIEGAGRHVMEGSFTQVDPPRRLGYRLKPGPVEGMETPPPSDVQVDFKDLGERRTEVCVTVAGLNASEYNDIVRAGWSAAFDKLSGRMQDAGQTVS